MRARTAGKIVGVVLGVAVVGGLVAAVGWYRSRPPPGMADEPGALREAEPYPLDPLAWARLRIAKGVHEGTVVPALAEVEELARLCFTTDSWIIQDAGLGLLAMIDRAQVAVPAAREFHPATRNEDREVMRRVIVGALAFGRLETPAPYDADLDRFALGKCSALREGAWLAHDLRPALGEALAADYARLDRLLAGHPECPLRAVRARWSGSTSSMWQAPTGVIDRLTSWVPFVRRTDGELMIAIADQDWFRRYEPEASGQ